MAIQAGDVIDEARDLHPAFDKNRNPVKIVRRALSRYVSDLLAKINEIDETGLTIENTTALPLGVFANGIALPANRGVQEVGALGVNGDPISVDLIPAGQRDQPRKRASAWIINNVLYLNGAASDWNSVTSVSVRYTPAAGQVLTDADVLALPDSARSTVVAALAAFMAKRGQTDKDGDLPQINVAQFSADAAQAEKDFLTEIGNTLTSQVFRVRDVWPRGKP